jgi:hypothetical protein
MPLTGAMASWEAVTGTLIPPAADGNSRAIRTPQASDQAAGTNNGILRPEWSSQVTATR